MFRRIWLLLMGVAFFTATQTMASTNADDARHFADSVGMQVLGVLNTSSLSEDQKQKKLRQIFSDNVDIAWMGHFVLGRSWQQDSPQQRDHYMRAYHEYLLTRYTSDFSDYSGSKYTITNARDDGNGQFTVMMKINSPNASQQQETDAGYHLHLDENGQLKIFDIIIDGVSQITAQRSEFASVIGQGGIDALINDMEYKAKHKSQQSELWHYLALYDPYAA